jgi:hypothetical protein
MQSSGADMSSEGMTGANQGAGGAWQGSDRDVTSPPQREWTTVGNERQSNPNVNTADRTGRA